MIKLPNVTTCPPMPKCKPPRKTNYYTLDGDVLRVGKHLSINVPVSIQSGPLLDPVLARGLWYVAKDQQARIDELEQKVKDWERSYKEVTSAWSHDKIKQQAIIETLEASIKTAWWHTEQATNYRKKYGVHLAAALKGEKLASEPVDQRLDAVRELVARYAELKDYVSDLADHRQKVPSWIQEDAQAILASSADLNKTFKRAAEALQGQDIKPSKIRHAFWVSKEDRE